MFLYRNRVELGFGPLLFPLRLLAVFLFRFFDRSSFFWLLYRILFRLLCLFRWLFGLRLLQDLRFGLSLWFLFLLNRNRLLYLLLYRDILRRFLHRGLSISPFLLLFVFLGGLFSFRVRLLCLRLWLAAFGLRPLLFFSLTLPLELIVLFLPSFAHFLIIAFLALFQLLGFLLLFLLLLLLFLISLFLCFLLLGLLFFLIFIFF